MAPMVKTLDDNVGKLMDALDDLGLAENTLLIFTSDNGGNMYDRPEGVYPTNNHPLRAGKGNSYEGGVRVPLIVSWPGVVPAGVVSNAINISYDWFPTFTLAAMCRRITWWMGRVCCRHCAASHLSVAPFSRSLAIIYRPLAISPMHGCARGIGNFCGFSIWARILPMSWSFTTCLLTAARPEIWLRVIPGWHSASTKSWARILKIPQLCCHV